MIVPTTIHSLLGLFAIILLCAQVVLGLKKHSALSINEARIYRFHGDLGLLTWDMLCITLLTGLLEFLVFSSIFSFIFVLLSICLPWFSVHAQMKHRHDDQGDKAALGSLIQKEPHATGTDGTRDAITPQGKDELQNSNFRATPSNNELDPKDAV